MGRLTVFILVLGLPVWAQPGPTAQKFLANVKGWTGSLDIHGTGSGTIASPAGGSATYKTDMHTSGILTLDSFNSSTGSWVGTLNGAIVITEQSILSFVCTITSTFTANTSAQTDGLGSALKWNLTPDNGSDSWSLWPSNNTVKGVDTAVTDCAGQTSTTSANQGLRFGEISFKMGFPFPSSGYDLKDTRTYHCTGCGNANTNPVDFTYTYDLKANTSQPSITVTTNPAGLRITVDGASLLSPQTFNWDPGSTHTIGTTSPQGAGTLYTFDSWSDGGNQSHTITTPASNTTYTARFNAQYLLTAVVSPDKAGTVTSDPCCVNGYFDNGSDVKVTAAPACGFQFSNWTGDLTGSVNPGTVHIIQPATVTANFTTLAGGCTNPKAQLTSPSPGSTLGSSATFTWGAISGASGYWLSVGSVAGGGDIYAGSAGGGTSITLLNLPTDGRNIYVRLGTLSNAVWQYIDSVFKAAGSNAGATMVTPTPGSTLSGASVTFTWTSVSGAPGYVLTAGSTPQGSDYFSQQGSVTSQTVSGLPADGNTVYVRLGTLNANGAVQWADYTYTAAGATSKAVMIIPTPGASLSGSSITFTWSAGSGAAAYWLDVATNPGGFDIFSQSTGLSTSQTVSAIPTDGGTIYVRLWTAFAGATWQFNDYTYTASTVPTKGVMISPAPGSGLTGSTVTFTWNPAPAASAYWLDVGAASGGFSIFSQSAGLSTSQAVTGLPIDGSTIYVRLWTAASASTWLYNDYTYTAAGGISKAVMLTPVPGSTLTGTNVTFTWSAGSGAGAYWLDVATTAGGFDLFSQSAGLATSQAVAGLPAGGVSVYVRLWTAFSGTSWQYNDYTYKAVN